MSTNDANVKYIGRMNIFSAERLGTGRFGSFYFPRKFKNVDGEVAIKRMDKKLARVDTTLYLKANGQPNIIYYYGTESTDQDEFM